MARILVANDTIVIEYEGQRVFFHKGKTLVREGHPILKGIEEYFEPVTVHYDTVEQATAAPGEKRTTRRTDTEREADDNAELGRLQVEAEKAGVKVDKRWGVDRLREELAKAKG